MHYFVNTVELNEGTIFAFACTYLAAMCTLKVVLVSADLKVPFCIKCFDIVGAKWRRHVFFFWHVLTWLL